ncbi:protein LTO1 homolog [Watersipora subatra]|uniref:protein LTO1 homolog n=1 Tax=Watersipora subatra TaxID=2589382 RepID=UPI00355B490D
MAKGSDNDVNIAFDALFVAEDSRYKEGLKDGEKMARDNNYHDGCQLGITKGSEHVQEVAFYEGFVETLLNWMDDEKKTELSQTSSGRRAMTVLAALDKLLKDTSLGSSILDPSQSNLTDDLDKVRGKFQQVMSLLKFDVSFGVPNSISF